MNGRGALPDSAPRAATDVDMVARREAYHTWKARFDAVTQLARIEQELMRLGYLTPSRAHYQRAANRLPLPPCHTCGIAPTGRYPDGSPLYRHYHEPAVNPCALDGPTDEEEE